MEAEVRAILTEAVAPTEQRPGLFTTLLDRFGELGGLDMDIPARTEPARAADLT